MAATRATGWGHGEGSDWEMISSFVTWVTFCISAVLVVALLIIWYESYTVLEILGSHGVWRDWEIESLNGLLILNLVDHRRSDQWPDLTLGLYRMSEPSRQHLTDDPRHM